MLRVAFIIESEDSAAAHYRVMANIAAFEREGIDAYPLILPVSLRQRRKLFRETAAFDAVVLQRRLIQPWEFAMLRRHAVILGYDFDDALLFRDRGGVRFGSFSRRVKFNAIVRGVDFVTAGNAYLASLGAAPRSASQSSLRPSIRRSTSPPSASRAPSASAGSAPTAP